MDTLSGEIDSVIWESTPKALKTYHSVIWESTPKTLKFHHSGIWKPVVNNLKIYPKTLKFYPFDNQNLLKLSDLSAQVPDAFKKRISTINKDL